MKVSVRNLGVIKEEANFVTTQVPKRPVKVDHGRQQ